MKKKRCGNKRNGFRRLMGVKNGIFEKCVKIIKYFFFICFAIGAVFGAIVAYFIGSISIEVIIFIICSILSLYLIRPIFKKMISKSDTVSSNVDALIGADGVVSEKIMPFKTGFVKVFSEVWRAGADIEIEAGETVKVERVTGATLIVKKL